MIKRTFVSDNNFETPSRFCQKCTLFRSTTLKFSFSEKDTKICTIFLMVWTFTKQTFKPWGRLSKFLWPSQKSWSLQKSKKRIKRSKNRPPLNDFSALWLDTTMELIFFSIHFFRTGVGILQWTIEPFTKASKSFQEIAKNRAQQSTKLWCSRNGRTNWYSGW